MEHSTGPKRKFRRSPADISAELKEQIMALRTSCEGYDNGNYWEAKRLATSIYLLCHDGSGRTKSLLAQAGIRPNLRLPSCVAEKEEPDGSYSSGMLSPLIMITLERKDGVNSARYAPVKEHAVEDYELVQFGKWWETEQIHSNIYGTRRSRKNIVFILRSQDGGSHYDEAISDEQYWVMKTEGDPHFCYKKEDGTLYGPMIELATGRRVAHPRLNGEQPIMNAPSAIVRQIAWELDRGLSSEGL